MSQPWFGLMRIGLALGIILAVVLVGYIVWTFVWKLLVVAFAVMCGATVACAFETAIAAPIVGLALVACAAFLFVGLLREMVRADA